VPYGSRSPAYQLLRVRLEDYERLRSVHRLLVQHGTAAVDTWLRERGQPPLRARNGRIPFGEVLRAGSIALEAQIRARRAPGASP
jgi:hypothetical protein